MQTEAEALLEKLVRRRAYIVLGVTGIALRSPGFRGKVNLGKAAGARGTNGRAARAVEKALKYDLISEIPAKGNCLTYWPTMLGQAVYRLHQGE